MPQLFILLPTSCTHYVPTVSTIPKKPSEATARLCRGRLIVPIADLSASGQTTPCPDLFVHVHYRAPVWLGYSKTNTPNVPTVPSMPAPALNKRDVRNCIVTTVPCLNRPNQPNVVRDKRDIRKCIVSNVPCPNRNRERLSFLFAR